ncbi:MAG: PAS domain-containing protein, partial [Candidatus Omnitrophica bacterium]|nr:PAS domain-containing protein [Candidatus Omnitrophota bacterium]
LDKLIKDPLEEVHLIIEAVRAANKSGGEKAKKIINSVTGKLGRVRDDLYICVVENKEDETTDYTYRSSEILGKELSRQIKTLKLSEEITPVVDQMTNTLTMIMDQVEAKKILNIGLKGQLTLKKKGALIKKIMQRQKASPDFEFLMKKLLALKGMPENEVMELFEQKLSIIESLEEEKKSEFSEELKPALEMLSQDNANLSDVMSKLKEIVSKTVDSEVKLHAKKMQLEKNKLSDEIKSFSEAFADISQGVLIFDENNEVIFLNPRAEELTGLKQQDKLDEVIAAALADWQADKQVEPAAQMSDSARKIISEVKSVRKGNNERLIVIFKT